MRVVTNPRAVGTAHVKSVCLLALGLFSVAVGGRVALGQSGVLTNIGQIRSLSPEDAGRHPPVHISGVVISDPGPEGNAIVIWNDASVYAGGDRALVERIKRGDFIEAAGKADPGGFAPIVALESVRVLGTKEIPPPIPASYAQLADGHMDAQWVEIAGVVRSCEPLPGKSWKTTMRLDTGGNRLLVQIDNYHASGAFMDAEVRLRGICFNQYNRDRQALGPSLLIPRGEVIDVTKDSSHDAYAMPVTSITNLMRFTPASSYHHRVHLRGIVTHSERGQFIWIREGERGLRVLTDQTQELADGNEVDVLGFPAYGGYTPVIEDGVFRKRSAGAVPAPVELSSLTNAWQHDADLVSVDGWLLETRATSDGWLLLLSWNDTQVRVSLRLPRNAALPVQWRVGSRVRVMGICSVQTDPSGPLSGLLEPQSFQLLMRDLNDCWYCGEAHGGRLEEPSIHWRR